MIQTFALPSLTGAGSVGGEHPDLHMGILQAALSRNPHAHGSSPETHPVACSLGRGSALRARPLSARGPDVAATHWVHRPRGSPSICGCSLVLSCCPTPTASSRKPSGLFYHTFSACLVGHLPDPLHCLLLRVIGLWGPWSWVPPCHYVPPAFRSFLPSFKTGGTHQLLQAQLLVPQFSPPGQPQP